MCDKGNAGYTDCYRSRKIKRRHQQCLKISVFLWLRSIIVTKIFLFPPNCERGWVMSLRYIFIDNINIICLVVFFCCFVWRLRTCQCRRGGMKPLTYTDFCMWMNCQNHWERKNTRKRLLFSRPAENNVFWVETKQWNGGMRVISRDTDTTAKNKQENKTWSNIYIINWVITIIWPELRCFFRLILFFFLECSLFLFVYEKNCIKNAAEENLR